MKKFIKVLIESDPMLKYHAIKNIKESTRNKGVNLYRSEFWELEGGAIFFFKSLFSVIEITLSFDLGDGA